MLCVVLCRVRVLLCQFFFFQQRSVRPSGPLTFMEKQALAAVACALPYAILVCIFVKGRETQGDTMARSNESIECHLTSTLLRACTPSSLGSQYPVDGSCQLYIPLGLLIVNLFADGGLSMSFVALFVSQYLALKHFNMQLWRETPSSCQGVGQRPGVMLEAITRKHAIALSCTIVGSSSYMVYMLISDTVDGLRMQKLRSTIGAVHILVTTLVCTLLLYKPRSTLVRSIDDKHTRNTSVRSILSDRPADSDQRVMSANNQMQIQLIEFMPNQVPIEEEEEEDQLDDNDNHDDFLSAPPVAVDPDAVHEVYMLHPTAVVAAPVPPPDAALVDVDDEP